MQGGCRLRTSQGPALQWRGSSFWKRRWRGVLWAGVGCAVQLSGFRGLFLYLFLNPLCWHKQWLCHAAGVSHGHGHSQGRSRQGWGARCRQSGSQGTGFLNQNWEGESLSRTAVSWAWRPCSLGQVLERCFGLQPSDQEPGTELTTCRSWSGLTVFEPRLWASHVTLRFLV